MRKFWLGLSLSGMTLITPIVLILVVLSLTLGTPTGSRWSLQIAAYWLEPLTVSDIRGSWARGVSVGQLEWRDEAATVSIDQLSLLLHTGHLLRGSLKILPLSVDSVTVSLHGEAADDEIAIADDERIELPTILLPLMIELPEVTLAALNIHAGDSHTQLQDIALGLSLSGSSLRIHTLSLRMDETRVSVRGRIRLRGDYRLRLRSELSTPQLPGELHARLRGSLADLQLQAQLHGEWPLELNARLEPLSPTLPFNIELSSEQGFTPRPYTDVVDIHQLTLKASGDLLAAEAELHTTFNDPYYGDSQVSVNLDWRPDQLRLQELRWQQGEHSPLVAQCMLALDSIQWNCQATVAELSLSPWLGDARQGELSTSLTLTGSWQEHLALSLSLPDIHGHLDNKPLTGVLQLHTTDGELWELRELRLRGGDNRLSASGVIGSHNNLQAEFQGEQLQQLYPLIQGRMNARLALSGELSTPTADLQLQGQALRYDDWQLAALDISLQLADAGNATSQLTITLDELDNGELPLLSSNLHVSGTRAQQSIQIQGSEPTGSRLQLKCNNQLDDELQALALTCTDLSGVYRNIDEDIRFQLQAPLALNWRAGDEDRSQSVTVSPACITAQDASLCLHETLRYEADQLSAFRLSLQQLPLEWLTKQLDTLQLQPGSTLNAEMNFHQLNPLSLDASLQIPEIHWRWSQEDESEASASLKDFRADLSVGDALAQLQAGAQSDALGELALQLDIHEPLGERRLDGLLRLSGMELEALAWAAPDLSTLSGRIESQLRFSGTADAPELHGRLQLEEGVIATPQLAETITGIQFIADFDQREANFRGQFDLGGGSGKLQGLFTLPEQESPWKLAAELGTNAIQVTPMPDSQLTLSSRFALAARPGHADITGNVDIDRANIVLNELPPETQGVSADAEIVGVEQESPWLVNADVRLNLGDNFHFRGFGAEVDLAGALRLRQTPGRDLRATGEVRVPRGRYRAYGQRLVVRRGSFLFNGPIDNPDITLEALREMPPDSDLVVGVRVSGPLQDPTAALFSEPPRSETEVAYLFLTGRPPDEFGQGAQMSAESALLSIGLAGSVDRAARAAERIGIQDLQVGTVTGEEGTQAQVSGYLSSRLYVRYGTSMQQGGNTVTFQYRLTKRLLLEAVTGLDQALDLIYSFSFDGRRSTRREEEERRGQ